METRPQRRLAVLSRQAAAAAAGGAPAAEAAPAAEMSDTEKFMLDLNGYVKDPQIPPHILVLVRIGHCT